MPVNRCWICGDRAESSEHKFKRTDITRLFGPGPYLEETSVLHQKEDQRTPVLGPSAQILKFEKNLCSQCNGTHTQPYDLAYQQLNTWVFANEADVLRARRLSFPAVFGERWMRARGELTAYLAKWLGCRIDSAGWSVPSDLIEFVLHLRGAPLLAVEFMVSEQFLPLNNTVKWSAVRPLVVNRDPNTGAAIEFESGIQNQWFFIALRYFFPPPNGIDPASVVEDTGTVELASLE